MINVVACCRGRRRHEGGFTLIELLVVISIIALLMSIMMPALGQVKRIAQATVCTSNLRHMSLAYEMFAESNGDTLPCGWWYDLYNYYGKELKLLLCPSAKKKGMYPCNPGRESGCRRGGKNQAWVEAEVEFPDGRLVPQVLGSYGQNGHVGGCDLKYAEEEASWLRTSDKGAPEAPVLLDGAGGGVPRVVDEPPEYDGQIYFGYDPEFGTPNIHEIRSFCVNRHPTGTVNCLFLDWHVRKVGLKELWGLRWHKEWPRPPLWPDWDNYPWMSRFPDP